MPDILTKTTGTAGNLALEHQAMRRSGALMDLPDIDSKYNQVIEALGDGAAQSWVLANRSGRMVENDYPLGFKLSLHRKDLGIALGLADQLGVSLPLAAMTAALESGLIAQGHGDEDMSALARSIRQLSGLDG